MEKGIPVWTYLWNHQSACTWIPGLPQEALPLVGATHTGEIPFVFGNLDVSHIFNTSCSFSAQDQGISRTLVNAWTSMAATQDPSGYSFDFPWPQYNASSIGLVINETVSVGEVDYSVCRFWDEINAMQYNQTNATSTTGGINGTTSPSSGNGTGPASSLVPYTGAASTLQAGSSFVLGGGIIGGLICALLL